MNSYDKFYNNKIALVFAALYLILFFFDITYHFLIEITGSQNTTFINFLGYVILAFPFYLFIQAIKNKIFDFHNVILIIIFLFILSLNIAIAKYNQTDFLSLFSREGVIYYLVHGTSFGLSILFISHNIKNTSKSLILFLLIGFFIYLLIFLNYLTANINFFSYKNYQVSTSLYIIFSGVVMMPVIMLINRYLNNNLLLLLSLFFSIYIILAIGYISMLSGSNMAAVYILCISLAIISFYIYQKNYLIILGLTAFFFIFIQFFQISFSDVFMNTRLAIFTETYNVFDITSVSSRVEVLKKFYQQVSLNPIGSWDAHIIYGDYSGDYSHSYALSLISHTGIIGFLIHLIFNIRFFFGAFKVGLNSMHKEFCFIIIILFFLISLGNFTTFFTWSVIWFCIGIMLIKPSTFQKY